MTRGAARVEVDGSGEARAGGGGSGSALGGAVASRRGGPLLRGRAKWLPAPRPAWLQPAPRQPSLLRPASPAWRRLPTVRGGRRAGGTMPLLCSGGEAAAGLGALTASAPSSAIFLSWSMIMTGAAVRTAGGRVATAGLTASAEASSTATRRHLLRSSTILRSYAGIQDLARFSFSYSGLAVGKESRAKMDRALGGGGGPRRHRAPRRSAETGLRLR